MPFIAIAALIAIALGGGVTYAADQAKPGDALYQYKVEVNDNLRHEYHAVRASLGVEENADANASITGEEHSQQNPDVDTDASSTEASGPSHGLMIRTDGQGNTSVPANLNADGSVHVNVY